MVRRPATTFSRAAAHGARRNPAPASESTAGIRLYIRTVLRDGQDDAATMREWIVASATAAIQAARSLGLSLPDAARAAVAGAAQGIRGRFADDFDVFGLTAETIVRRIALFAGDIRGAVEGIVDGALEAAREDPALDQMDAVSHALRGALKAARDLDDCAIRQVSRVADATLLRLNRLDRAPSGPFAHV